MGFDLDPDCSIILDRLQYSDYEKNHLKAWPMSLETPILLPAPKKEPNGLHISAGVMRASDQ